jgi:hypothetical protein
MSAGMIDRAIAFSTPGIVVTGEHRDTLQESRLSGAVLADNNCNRLVENQFKAVSQKRQTKGIGRYVCNARRVEPYVPKVRRR